VIGDIANDLALQRLPARISPLPGMVDVHIHGVPGRFLTALGAEIEIPVEVVAELLEVSGQITRGAPLRLLTGHGGEPCARGRVAAQLLATEWTGSVLAPNGLFHAHADGRITIDLVEWSSAIAPDVATPGGGLFVPFHP
jgi:hypothetical protein